MFQIAFTPGRRAPRRQRKAKRRCCANCLFFDSHFETGIAPDGGECWHPQHGRWKAIDSANALAKQPERAGATLIWEGHTTPFVYADHVCRFHRPRETSDTGETRLFRVTREEVGAVTFPAKEQQEEDDA